MPAQRGACGVNLLLLDELGLQKLLLELQHTSHPADHLKQNKRGKVTP